MDQQLPLNETKHGTTMKDFIIRSPWWAVFPLALVVWGTLLFHFPFFLEEVSLSIFIGFLPGLWYTHKTGEAVFWIGRLNVVAFYANKKQDERKFRRYFAAEIIIAVLASIALPILIIAH